MLYGLIGKSLKHSVSPKIHSLLGNKDYELLELQDDEIELFMKKRNFKGINVTIPYKEKVMQYLDYIDDNAKRIGCVNTIINKNGKLYGYNTDYEGFKELIIDSKIIVNDKKILILGSGGTSKTVKTVLSDLGANSFKIVSRSEGENKISYNDALKEIDTQIIINTTPVGMYPNVSTYPLVINEFKNLEAVVDVVYNPLKTRLICFAKKRRIKAVGGLKMLVSQAIYSHQLFFNTKVSFEVKKKIYGTILREMLNIVLIGMPGCGKSTIAKYLGVELNKNVIDLDKEIELNEGMKIKDIFSVKGEQYFRDVESQIVSKYAKTFGKIIATGGGAVKNKKNIAMLRQNGLIIYVQRDVSLLEALSNDKRPLARSKEDLERLYLERRYLYLNAADIVVKNNARFIECAKAIKEGFDEVYDY